MDSGVLERTGNKGRKAEKITALQKIEGRVGRGKINESLAGRGRTSSRLEFFRNFV
jgi:hypothetical protein